MHGRACPPELGRSLISNIMRLKIVDKNRTAFVAVLAACIVAIAALAAWRLRSPSPPADLPAAKAPEIRNEGDVQPNDAPVLESGTVARIEAPVDVAPQSDRVVSEARPVPVVRLHVSVKDMAGQPALAGTIDCLFGRIGVEVDPKAEQRDVSISGATTTIELPIQTHEAVITAVVPGFPAVQTRASDLHRKAGRWFSDEESVDHDVELVLQDETRLHAVVRGVVHIDGVARVPESLVVRAHAEKVAPGATDARPTRLAVVDRTRSEYRFDELPPGTWRIEATSAETVLNSVTCVLPEGNALEGLDLYLASGATLTVRALDADSRAPVAGRRLRLSYSIAVMRTSEMVLMKPVQLDTLTDADGRCAFHALPRGLHLLLEDLVDAQASEEARLDILLDPSEGADVHREFLVDRPHPEFAEYWGEVARALDGKGELVICARSEFSSGPVDSEPVSAGRWSIARPANVQCTLWLERDGQRVSQAAQLRRGVGRHGPIDLEPLQQSRVRLDWSDAPIGWQASVFTGDPIAKRSNATNVALNRSEGHVELDAFEGGGIGVQLKAPDTSFVHWGLSGVGADRTASVDLLSRRRASVHVRLNFRRLDRDADLVLVPLDLPTAVSSAFTLIRVPVGGESRPMTIFPGRNYFQMVPPVRESGEPTWVVTGVIDTDASRQDAGEPLVIEWSGTLVAPQVLGLVGQNPFEVVECSGVGLEGVSSAHRRVSRTALEWGSSETDARPFPPFYFDLEHCSLRALKP